jgi:hypothetical protein
MSWRRHRDTCNDASAFTMPMRKTRVPLRASAPFFSIHLIPSAALPDEARMQRPLAPDNPKRT